MQRLNIIVTQNLFLILLLVCLTSVKVAEKSAFFYVPIVKLWIIPHSCSIVQGRVTHVTVSKEASSWWSVVMSPSCGSSRFSPHVYHVLMHRKSASSNRQCVFTAAVQISKGKCLKFPLTDEHFWSTVLQCLLLVITLSYTNMHKPLQPKQTQSNMNIHLELCLCLPDGYSHSPLFFINSRGKYLVSWSSGNLHDCEGKPMQKC